MLNFGFKYKKIRFILAFLLFPFMVVLIASSALFFTIGTNNYARMIKENAWSVVEHSSHSLNLEIDNIYATVQDLTMNIEFLQLQQRLLRGDTPVTSEEYVHLTRSMTDFLNFYSVYMEWGGLYLSNQLVYFTKSNMTTDFRLLGALDYKDYLREDGEKINQRLHWVNISNLLPANLVKENTVEMGLLSTFGSTNTEVTGYFILGLREAIFFNHTEHSRITSGSSVAFITSDGRIISGDGYQGEQLATISSEEKQLIIDSIAKQSDESLIFETTHYHVVYAPIDIDGMGIMAVIPIDELYGEFHQFIWLFIFIILATFIAFAVLYFIIPRYLAKPVIQVLEQIEQVQNIDDVNEIKVEGFQEISRVGDEINKMLVRIGELSHTIQNETEAKYINQLLYLSAQINAHFLYNTLDAIKELSLQKENEKVAILVDRLAVFYRIGVSKEDSYITVEEELKHISSYLDILKIRYEDFQYKVILEEEIKGYKILRMLLQPFVENAIYHGIRSIGTGGTVEIHAYKKGEYIELHVKDDGIGMTEDVHENILKIMKQPIMDYTENRSKAYGVKNVQDRLRLAYGKKGRIDIETEYDKGTDVKILIPYRRDSRC